MHASSHARTKAAAQPVVDIAGLRRGDEVQTRELRRALLDHGYFYAANVEDLPAEYIASVYDYSRRAHALPASVKRTYAQRGGTGSYSGPDIGQPELQYEADGAKANVCGWDYSRTRFSLGDARTFAEGSDARYPPEGILSPSFSTVLDELYERQDNLARVLMTGFEAALDLPERTLLGMFEGEGSEGDYGTIRLLMYPGRQGGGAADDDDKGPGIGAHTDFECFTLMHQSARGLQLMPRRGDGHGDWVDAPVVPADFVVIIGDMLERLTNGTLLATPHRVLNTPHPRWSIIRFNAFAPGTVIRPLEQFVSEERPARYSPAVMREHMETTMKNLEAGLGSWDVDARRSISANYRYRCLDSD